MIKVAIELNGVVRNINKQILKYYAKDFDKSIDLDEIDEKDDPYKVVKFDSLKARNEFLYIDYPYEIFGCAKAMEKDLPRDLNNWLSELTNFEDEEIEISFFSLHEEAITIQSSYFFLSKIGTRVRKVFFPSDVSEVTRYFDLFITSNEETVKSAKEHNKPVILINNTINEVCKENSNYNYDSLTDVIKDGEITKKIYNLIHGETE